jgi:4-hydroxy-3-polyprenylbenzoate decarboxylase
MLLLPVAPLDTLDYTSFRLHVGSKLVLDATGEAITTAAPPEEVSDPRAFDRRIRRHVVIEGWLVVEVERDPREVLEQLVRWEGLGPVRFIVAVSDDVDLADESSTVWGIFTRFDPARDMIVQDQSFVGARPVYRGRIGIDATWKEGYPPTLTMPDEVQKLVERRWGEYFGDRLERRARGSW